MPSPPLRVLVLATTFPGRAGDGTPEFVLTLSSALAHEGASVTVVAPRVKGASRREIMDGVSVRRFAYFPHRWESLADGAIMANLREGRSRALQVAPLILAFMCAAWRAARSERPEVIQAHWIVPAGVVALALHKIAGVPYVVTVHGADAYTLQSRPARWVKKRVLRGAAATVPVSRAIGDELRPLGPVAEVVPMGVDVARVRSEVSVRSPEPGRVLFIGRLVEKKGVDVLLDAVARVERLHLVVAGGGPLADALRVQASRLGIEQRVEFLGVTPRSEVMRELSRAAVLALPSTVGAGGDQDGVPVVLGEAMAAGVPVVGTRSGGLAEHVSDRRTGRLVDPGSAKQLAEALDELTADPIAAAQLAEHAGVHVESELDIGVVARRYTEILRARERREPRMPEQ